MFNMFFAYKNSVMMVMFGIPTFPTTSPAPPISFECQVLYDAGSPGTEKVTLFSVWSPDAGLGAALPLQVPPPLCKG